MIWIKSYLILALWPCLTLTLLDLETPILGIKNYMIFLFFKVWATCTKIRGLYWYVFKIGHFLELHFWTCLFYKITNIILLILSLLYIYSPISYRSIILSISENHIYDQLIIILLLQMACFINNDICEGEKRFLWVSE